MDTRLERALLNWTRSANSHTGRRHTTAASEAGHMSAPDRAPCSSQRFFLHHWGASTHVHKDSSQQHASFSKTAFTELHRLSITQNFCSDHGAQRDIGDLLLLVSLILWLMRDRPADVGLAAYGGDRDRGSGPADHDHPRPVRSPPRSACCGSSRIRSAPPSPRTAPVSRGPSKTPGPREPVHRLQRALRRSVDDPPVGGEGMMPACRQRLAHRSRSGVSCRRRPTHSRRSDWTQCRARMLRPTRPGDVLHVEIVPSRAHPGGGTVVACGETRNQRREVVQITTVGLIIAAPKLGCRWVLRAEQMRSGGSKCGLLNVFPRIALF